MRRIHWTLTAALVFATASSLLGFLFLFRYWIPWTALSSFTTGAVFWWLLVESAKRSDADGGALAGAIAGFSGYLLVVSHGVFSFYVLHDERSRYQRSLGLDLLLYAVVLLGGVTAAAVCAWLGSILTRVRRSKAAVAETF